MDAIRLVSAIIDTLSIVLNTATAFANLPYLRKLPPSSFLIVFICLCDAFHTLNDVITVCAHVLIPDATKSVCKTTAILSTLGGMSSILLCTGLILFRYLVIIHEISIPFWFAPSYTAVSFFIILALVSIPVFLSATNETYGVHPTGLICTVVWYKTDAVTRSVSIICAVVLAALILFIVYAYTTICLRMVKVTAQVKEAVIEDARETVTGSTLSRVAKDSQERQKRLLVQSIVLVSNMVLGWGPYLIFALIEMVTGENTSIEFERMAEVLVGINAVLNPIFVLLFDQDVRRNVFRVFNRIRNF